MPRGASRMRSSANAAHNRNEEKDMKNDKRTDEKKGTLRPWLVDVQVEHLR